MNKTFKLGSVVAALVLGGMLVGCGSSSSDDNSTTPPGGGDEVMGCTYNANDNVTVMKGYDMMANHEAFINQKVKMDSTKPLAWDKDKNPLEWNSEGLTLVGHMELNTSVVGSKTMAIIANGCDNNKTVRVDIVEESTGTDTDAPTGDTVLPF